MVAGRPSRRRTPPAACAWRPCGSRPRKRGPAADRPCSRTSMTQLEPGRSWWTCSATGRRGPAWSARCDRRGLDRRGPPARPGPARGRSGTPTGTRTCSSRRRCSRRSGSPRSRRAPRGWSWSRTGGPGSPSSSPTACDGLLVDDDAGMARALVRLVHEPGLRARLQARRRRVPPVLHLGPGARPGARRVLAAPGPWSAADAALRPDAEALPADGPLSHSSARSRPMTRVDKSRVQRPPDIGPTNRAPRPRPFFWQTP